MVRASTNKDEYDMVNFSVSVAQLHAAYESRVKYFFLTLKKRHLVSRI